MGREGTYLDSWLGWTCDTRIGVAIVLCILQYTELLCLSVIVCPLTIAVVYPIPALLIPLLRLYDLILPADSLILFFPSFLLTHLLYSLSNYVIFTVRDVSVLRERFLPC